MAAAEAGLEWDIISAGSGSTEIALHHPFRRAPAAYMDGLHINESAAICSYTARRHNGGALHPDDAEGKRACGNALMLPPIMYFR